MTPAGVSFLSSGELENFLKTRFGKPTIIDAHNLVNSRSASQSIVTMQARAAEGPF